MLENEGDVIDPQVEKFRDLVEDIKIAMFSTVDSANHLHSAPMVTQAMSPEGYLWFLTSKESLITRNIEFNSHVNLTYSATGKYVSATGNGELVNDDLDKIHQLWSKPYEVWFSGGPNDPRIQLIKVEISQVEYWEGHSYPVSKILEFAKYVTGSKNIKLGEHGELNIKH